MHYDENYCDYLEQPESSQVRTLIACGVAAVIVFGGIVAFANALMAWLL